MIMGLLVFILINCTEVDARATFQGSEERNGKIGADPFGHSVEAVAGNETAAVVHFGNFKVVSFKDDNN